MQYKYPELDGWLFEIEEISANVYKVIARNKFGNQIVATGSDVEALLEKCKQDAFKITK